MKTPEEISKLQFSEEFVKGMKDRMITSYYKYGSIYDCFPHKSDAIRSAMDRIRHYEKTKNREFLVDASNFLMIEFMIPSLPETYFRSTDSDESPGIITTDGKRVHRME